MFLDLKITCLGNASLVEVAQPEFGRDELNSS
jgi:hypothetical protein